MQCQLPTHAGYSHNEFHSTLKQIDYTEQEKKHVRESNPSSFLLLQFGGFVLFCWGYVAQVGLQLLASSDLPVLGS